MAISQHNLRMIIAQSSYRKANRIRQSLVLAGYTRENLFEVITGDECWQLFQEEYPVHLVMVSPNILVQFEKAQLVETIRAQFPDVALLLLPEEDTFREVTVKNIQVDYTLAPPVTADALGIGIVAALENRQQRVMAKRYISQGERALEQNRVEEAQQYFQEAVRVSDRDAYPCYVLGDLLAQLGKEDEAITAFIQCWEREPGNIQPVHRIVQLNLRRNDVAGAIVYLEYAIQQGVALIPDQVHLAALYFEIGDEKKLHTILRAAYSAQAEQAIHEVVEQAKSLQRRKGDEAAIAFLQAGKEICPENTLIYAMLGDLFTNRQQLREALVCFEHLIRLGNPLPENYCRLAKSYLALGFPLRAEKALDKALKIDPECQEAIELRSAAVQ